jgi:hypothetical protein
MSFTPTLHTDQGHGLPPGIGKPSQRVDATFSLRVAGSMTTVLAVCVCIMTPVARRANHIVLPGRRSPLVPDSCSAQ